MATARMLLAWVSAAWVSAAVIAAPMPTAAAEPVLPNCARVAAVVNPETPLGHPDCRLHTRDGKNLTMDVKYWSTDGPGSAPMAVKVIVTDGSGKVVDTLDELLEPSSPAGVGLADLSGDGHDEVIIPMSQIGTNGGLNSRFSVWRAPGDSTHFERVQMFGQAVYPTGDGFVVTNSGGLSSRDLDFYLPTAAGYTQIVTATIQAEEIDGATNRVLTVSCRVHQQSGLGAIDMSVDDAQIKFCGSPTAYAIWPNARRI